ncbi:hypothetical protein E2562_022395 [Oryza meyeriana var. granulata]|uniref:Uncharacterized protein n=1 Tax=Oryza meyeriana var. granulata TaxID=110450 RepID=A0A6G1EY61_9ORYZ|nr:hypothetical protein E2562_022395 [Oryza meyeriana var. granulata]
MEGCTTFAGTIAARSPVEAWHRLRWSGGMTWRSSGVGRRRCRGMTCRSGWTAWGGGDMAWLDDEMTRRRGRLG